MATLTIGASLERTEQVIGRAWSTFAPPPKLTVSQFADLELKVTAGPLAPSQWQTDFALYQRGIMDAFHEPGVEVVVVMGSSQWGKTAIAVNIVAYHIAHDPCPILVVEPTVDPMARDLAKNRLEPVINASPRLLDCVGRKRAKDASNTLLQKTFRGGLLSIGGANSAASLAARSIRLLVLDEVDRYPPELPGEGSTIEIALKRTSAYRERRRVFMPSSPTLKGGAIDTWFHRGDQRRYYVPCPKCGDMHPFTWADVRWTNHDPATARMHCPACDYGMGDMERIAAVRLGEWRAEAEPAEQSIVSFHMWEAYSPLSSLSKIVAGFIQAREAQKAGDAAEMHTWQNTTLGEPIEPDAGVGIESHVLLMRREEYGEDIPEGACVLTMGVDVQDDRLEVLVLGWGLGEESWLIDRQTLPGDTERPEPWDELTEVLNHPYKHALGPRLSAQATCIDSGGHRTTLVYDYAAKQAARRVYAIIGRAGQAPIVSSPSPRQWGREKRKVPLYTIGVDAAKALLVSRLGLTEKGPGYVHIPHTDWADEELAEQLSSERLMTRKTRGVMVQEWRKTRPRNDALDCAVYALAALRLLHPDLELLMSRLRDPEMPPPASKPRGQRWIPQRRGGWLR
jgi:phage terminase large subunit GpA-like protein